jgi:ubiquinone/menaquinone biosynthesis C-methylase UbiE
MKLDFGSGYNPKKGYFSCDIYGYVDYYFDPLKYKIDCDNNLFEEINCRNVIHHIKDIEKLTKEFKRVLRPQGIINIIECREENYSENYYLDYLWYRFIIPRKEIWFSNRYRNYSEIFKKYFKFEHYEVSNEKEFYKFSCR